MPPTCNSILICGACISVFIQYTVVFYKCMLGCYMLMTYIDVYQ